MFAFPDGQFEDHAEKNVGQKIAFVFFFVYWHARCTEYRAKVRTAKLCLGYERHYGVLFDIVIVAPFSGSFSFSVFFLLIEYSMGRNANCVSYYCLSDHVLWSYRPFLSVPSFHFWVIKESRY